MAAWSWSCRSARTTCHAWSGWPPLGLVMLAGRVMLARWEERRAGADCRWWMWCWLARDGPGQAGGTASRPPPRGCAMRATSVVTARTMGGPGGSCGAELVNQGSAALTVTSVTSFLAGAAAGDLVDLDVWWAGSDWLAEGRWTSRALRAGLPDLGPGLATGPPRGCFGRTSVGTWSSGRYLPMGALVSRVTGRAWLWQVEHQGGWHWQAGERGGAAYLALLGPTGTEHQWRVTLAPGERFRTVPATVAVSDTGFDGALAALTAGRRAVRRPHPDHQ